MSVYLKDPTPLHCYNESVIYNARNTIFHERTKYIEIDYHFTCHHFQQLDTISYTLVLLVMLFAPLFLLLITFLFGIHVFIVTIVPLFVISHF